MVYILPFKRTENNVKDVGKTTQGEKPENHDF